MQFKSRIPPLFTRHSRKLLFSSCSLATLTFWNYYSPVAQAQSDEELSDLERAKYPITLLALNGNRPLAEEISEIIGVPLSEARISKFSDGEIDIQIRDSLRGEDVYIIQSLSKPVHENLMEAILACTTCRRASANSITMVLPYLCYSRVDRLRPGETIAAADVLRLFEAAGADCILTVDVHRRQTEGFVKPDGIGGNGPDTYNSKPTTFITLESLRLSVPIILSKDLFNPVIVCPSSSGVTRGKKYMELLSSEGVNPDLAFVSPADSSGHVSAETCHHKVSGGCILVGDVKNCDVLIIDDMIDTGSRVSIAAEICKKNGAKRIFAYATHGLFSGNCVERLEEAPIDEIYVTNTIPYDDSKFCRKIMYTSIAPLVAEAIRRKTFCNSLQTLTHLKG